MANNRKIGIATRAVFSLDLTDAELKLLHDCSRAHYDHVCKQASEFITATTPAWQHEDQFIASWRRMAGNGFRWMQATPRQIDTCLKILEVAGYMFYSSNDSAVETEHSIKRRMVVDLRLYLRAGIVRSHELIKSETFEYAPS